MCAGSPREDRNHLVPSRRRGCQYASFSNGEAGAAQHITFLGSDISQKLGYIPTRMCLDKTSELVRPVNFPSIT